MISEFLDRIDGFLTEANAEWEKDDCDGEMWCEIKWDEGKWTIALGDGCSDGKSDAYCNLAPEQLDQAIERFLTEYTDWIKERPKYGHSVEIEKRVFEIAQKMLSPANRG